MQPDCPYQFVGLIETFGITFSASAFSYHLQGANMYSVVYT